MSNSYENSPTKAKRSYKKMRREVDDVEDLRRKFERKQHEEMKNLEDYLKLKGELE